MKRILWFTVCLSLALVPIGRSASLWADEPAREAAEKEAVPADAPPAATVPTGEEAAPTDEQGETTDEKAAAAAKAKTERLSHDWPTGLERARHRAQLEGKPILVRAGASWCPWCDKLADELDDDAVKEQLKRFTLVYIDVDESRDEVRQLSIGPIPALRVVNAAGKLVSWRDGYLEHGELASWLRESLDGSQPNRPEVLTAEKRLAAGDVDELVKLLAASDPTVREAALRRLLARPDLAAQRVVEAFATGKLAVRLLALELLAQWHAPVAELDPWRPETLTAERIEALRLWTEDAAAAQPPASTELSAEALQTAEAELARLVEDDDSQASARIEQLARYGAALRPLVMEKLKAVPSDQAHQRLTLLRYRLAATDALALGWTGGLARLAAGDVKVRHRAASDLVERATTADEPLLLELFADEDPLVREISLRGLSAVGTDASSSALVKLLDDPQPNVRAAVLKQLAEAPNHATVEKISAYLEQETDPDLVVHGIRVLKAANAEGNLITLLHHESWQVRAEAAEALGSLSTKNASRTLPDEVAQALIEVLADPDPFVVSRAVEGLKSANLAAAVEPLAKAAADHPELAAEVLGILKQSPFQEKIGKVLHGYLEHAEPKMRAAAISALLPSEDEAGDLVERGLSDPSSEVRIATAHALFALAGTLSGINTDEQGKHSRIFAQAVYSVSSPVPVGVETSSPGIVESVFGFFFGGGGQRQAVRIELMEVKPDEAAKPDSEAKPDGEEKAEEKEKADAPKADDTNAAGTEKSEADAEKPAAADLPEAPGPPAPEDDAAEEEGGNLRIEVHEMQASAADGESNLLWLAVRSGQIRPEWMNRAVPGLEKMLQADSQAEKLAAALALLPFGRDEQALTVVRSVIAADHNLLGEASHALAWIAWDERIKMMEDLLALKPSESEFGVIAQEMILRDPDRGVRRLWKMLDDSSLSDQTALSIGCVILQVYEQVELNQLGAGVDPVDSPLPSVKPFAKDGTPWQKTIALSRMVESRLDEAGALAQAYFDQPDLPSAIRRDAFQLLLMARVGSEAEKLAVAQLGASDPAIRRLALIYLATGPESLFVLRGLIYNANFFTASNEALSLEPPPGLTAEMLEPLLADDDPEVTGAAGCMLALLGNSSGMPAVEKIMRERHWNEPAYRAIAALDDEAYVPILAEINKRLGTWEKRKFYWTIRSMHGSAVLKLRKQIRDEVGMDNLR